MEQNIQPDWYKKGLKEYKDNKFKDVLDDGKWHNIQYISDGKLNVICIDGVKQ